MELAPQAAGLFAISLGLSVNIPDDHAMLRHGLVIYDALYAWLVSAQRETHNWPPIMQEACMIRARQALAFWKLPPCRDGDCQQCSHGVRRRVSKAFWCGNQAPDCRQGGYR